jgi:hypothetical protein
MADTWRAIFKATIEGRPVEGEMYDEGGYRVHTTQNADDPGTVVKDGSSTLIIPPTEKGRRITIEGETLEEVGEGLADEGFSDAAVQDIVGRLRA